MANTVVDAAMTLALMKRLVTPFEKWPAYEHGIIDEDGKVLKPRKTLSADEKRYWGRFDILAANIKKIIQKVPGGKTRLGSLAAAAFLFKEGIDVRNIDVLEESLKKYVGEDMAVAGDTGGAANIVGGGKIAGVGIGPQGEPPGRSRLKKIRNIVKRKENVDR